MRMIDLILMNKKKRLFFSIISLAIAGITVVFSLFFVASVSQSITSQLPITKDEYYLIIDESRYSDIDINYYERLRESFSEVIPFVRTIDNISNIEIIGTDIDFNKTLINNNVYDFDVVFYNEISTTLPNVYVSQQVYSTLNSSNTIFLNNQEFNISRVINVENYEGINIAIMSVESYEEFINENIFVSNDGISKYIFEFYYIISTFGENETKLIIESVYSDFIDDSVVSYNELLNRELNDFSIIYQLPIIFFVLIAVVSFVNMNITIKLLVKDRIKFIKTLYIVGMKFSDLVKILVGEIVIVSSISSIVSLILGVLSSIIILSTYNQLSLTIPRIDYLIYVMILLVIIPVVQAYMSLISIRKKSVKKLIKM